MLNYVTFPGSGFGADQNQPKCLRNHIFATLKDVEENLKYVLVKDCSSKIKELFDLEKTTWNKLDSLEEECENLTNAVREKIERVVGDIIHITARIWLAGYQSYIH